MSLRRAALTCAAGAALAAGCGEGGDEVAAGVSRELARDRAGRVSELAYDVELSVPDSLHGPILGRVRLSFTLSEAGRPLAVDFAAPREDVLALRAGPGPEALEEVGIRLESDHLLLPAEAIREGPNLVEVEFRAGDGPLNRNPEFLYTLFVPDRAHRTLPVFDQPDLKARFRLTLEVPAGWEAVSNTRVVEEGAALPAGSESPGTASGASSGPEAAPDGGSPGGAPGGPEGDVPAGSETDVEAEADGRRRIRFAETEPLPTYLFAFAAGRFRVEEAEREGRAMRMYHRETDSAKVARNREAIFDLHARALEWLEEYTGIPYPFGKFDFVLVPSFQYGGMEHPGAILYRGDGLLLDASATKTDELGRASVIAHETAHMWFGDLVTMEWFDDVWMKEVFANFMAAKIVNPSFPEIDHDLRFLLSHYPAAYGVDRTAGANPIRQELENLSEAGSLYGAIIYQKAPIVMRHLERLVGEETFRDGLREYLGAHRLGNATWPDLIEVLDRRAPEDLEEWSRVWVGEPGRPAVTLEVRGEGSGDAGERARPGPEPSGGETSGARSLSELAAGAGRADEVSAEGVRLVLRQEDPRGRGLRWTQPLGVMVGSRAGEGRVLDLRLEGNSAAVETRLEPGEGAFYLAAGRGFGYGRFLPEPASREWLLSHLVRVEPPVARAAAWIGLWDGLLEGDVTPGRLLETALATLDPGREDPEELLVEEVLGDIRTLYQRFLPPEVQREARSRVEAVLWRGTVESATSSLQAAYFRTLRSLATSPESIRRLVALWRGEMEISGLELSERDRTDLAQMLALRQVPGWSTILEDQRAAIENPDRRARFDFVRPALSPDPAVRDTFFRSLADPANRSHEPWVLEAVSFLHHPSRAGPAVGYIRPGLEMLEEIQRTGDIFFPKRWLDATLGGHRSPEAAAVVRAFLEERPDLPRRLREKLLQSADLLFRAADRSADAPVGDDEPGPTGRRTSAGTSGAADGG